MNYYARHIGDYLTATAHLTLLEHGVYTRLLDVYYTREAPIPDEQAERLVGARTPEEREAVRAVLVEFFELVDGGWRQSRCDREIEAYQDKQAKASKSAEARWTKQRAERPDCDSSANEMPARSECNADAMRTHCEGNAPNPNTNISTSLRSVERARATRLPPKWLPPEPDWLFATEALGIRRASVELDKFRDYWAARSGKDAAKLDWPATWRNWIRRTHDDPKAGGGSRTEGARKLSAVERVNAATAHLVGDEAGRDFLAPDGADLRAQVAQPARRDADGTVVDGSFRVVAGAGEPGTR